jgi:hypothetical protein
MQGKGMPEDPTSTPKSYDCPFLSIFTSRNGDVEQAYFRIGKHKGLPTD